MDRKRVSIRSLIHTVDMARFSATGVAVITQLDLRLPSPVQQERVLSSPDLLAFNELMVGSRWL